MSVYESLPPQVPGEVLGFLRLKAKKLAMNDGTAPVGATIGFQWWGQRGTEITLNAAWKAGMPADEAVFPLRVSAASLLQYLKDMESLNINVYDKEKKLLGKASIPSRNLAKHGEIRLSVKTLKSGKQREVAVLQLELEADYTNSNGTQEPDLPIERVQVPIKKPVPQLIDKSPLRVSKRDGRAIDKPHKAELSSFQRNEAMALADFSDRFSEWPKQSSSSKNINANVNTKLSNQEAKKTDALSRSATSNTTKKPAFSPPQPQPAVGESQFRAPSVLQRAAVLRQSKRSTSALSSSSTGLTSDSIAASTPATDPSLRQVASQQEHGAFQQEQLIGTLAAGTRNNEFMHVTGAYAQNAGAGSPVISSASTYQMPGPSLNGGVAAMLAKAEELLWSVTDATSSSSASPRGVSHLTFPSSMERPTVASTTLQPQSQSRVLDGFPGQKLFSFPQVNHGGTTAAALTVTLNSGVDADSTMTQLDWLIRGVSEAYDDEDTDPYGGPLDDLAVDKLIREGGKPPSQLVFPSVHAAGQRIMEKLVRTRYLFITLNSILVYSFRFGVRRSCSKIVVRPPAGVERVANEPDIIVLQLPELSGRRAVHSIGGAPSETANVSPKKEQEQRGKVGSKSGHGARGGNGHGIDAFFVGEAELHRCIALPLELTDKVIQSWLNSSSDGRIRLELHSQISPPASTISGAVRAGGGGRVVKSESQCFGWVDIPLAGLLGTTTLDAVVTCEFVADKETHASVLNRQSALPFVTRSNPFEVLGSNLGKMTARLTLVDEESIADKRLVLKRGEVPGFPLLKKDSTGALPASSLLQPVHLQAKSREYNTQSNVTDSDTGTGRSAHVVFADPLHSAMDFLPNEAPKFVDKMLEPSECYLGVVIHDIVDFDLLKRNLPPREDVEAVRVSIGYKSSQSEREELQGPWMSCTEARSLAVAGKVPFGLARMHKIPGLSHVRPPVLELWIEWGSRLTSVPESESLLGGETSPGGSMDEIDLDRIRPPVEFSSVAVVVKERKLLGLGRFPPKAPFARIVSVPVETLAVSLNAPHVHDIEGLNKDSHRQVQGRVARVLVSLHVDENHDVTEQAIINALDVPVEVEEEEEVDDKLIQILPEQTDNAVADTIQCASSETKATSNAGIRDDDVRSSILAKAHDVAVPVVITKAPAKDDLVAFLDEQLSTRPLPAGDQLSTRPLPAGNKEQEAPSIVEEPRVSPPTPIANTNDTRMLTIAETRANISYKGIAAATDNDSQPVIVPWVPEDSPDDALLEGKVLSEEATAEHSSEHSSTNSIHILDLTVEGSAPVTQSSDNIGYNNNGYQQPAMGYFITYQLPGLASRADADGTAPQLLKLFGSQATAAVTAAAAAYYYTMWWDAECSVLNGRVRHIFEASCESSSTTSSTSSSVLNDGVIFNLFASDADGCLPDSPTLIASAHLPADVFRKIISSPGCNEVIELTLRPSGQSSRLVPPPLSLMRLSFSHRLQPALVQSIDGPLRLHHHQHQGAATSSASRSAGASHRKDEDSNGSVFAVSVTVERISHLTVGPLHQKDSEFFCTGGIVHFDGSSERIEDLDLGSSNVLMEPSFASSLRGYSIPAPSTTADDGDERDTDTENNRAVDTRSSSSSDEQPGKEISWGEEFQIYVKPKSGGEKGKNKATAAAALRSSALVVCLHTRAPHTASSDSYSVRKGHDSDRIIGYAVVELSTLACGMPELCGWYHLRDGLGIGLRRITGQVLLSVKPVEAIARETGELQQITSSSASSSSSTASARTAAAAALYESESAATTAGIGSTEPASRKQEAEYRHPAIEYNDYKPSFDIDLRSSAELRADLNRSLAQLEMAKDGLLQLDRSDVFQQGEVGRRNVSVSKVDGYDHNNDSRYDLDRSVGGGDEEKSSTPSSPKAGLSAGGVTPSRPVILPPFFSPEDARGASIDLDEVVQGGDEEEVEVEDDDLRYDDDVFEQLEEDGPIEGIEMNTSVASATSLPSFFSPDTREFYRRLNDHQQRDYHHHQQQQQKDDTDETHAKYQRVDLSLALDDDDDDDGDGDSQDRLINQSNNDHHDDVSGESAGVSGNSSEVSVEGDASDAKVRDDSAYWSHKDVRRDDAVSVSIISTSGSVEDVHPDDGAAAVVDENAAQHSVNELDRSESIASSTQYKQPVDAEDGYEPDFSPLEEVREEGSVHSSNSRGGDLEWRQTLAGEESDRYSAMVPASSNADDDNQDDADGVASAVPAVDDDEVRSSEEYAAEEGEDEGEDQMHGNDNINGGDSKDHSQDYVERSSHSEKAFTESDVEDEKETEEAFFDGYLNVSYVGEDTETGRSNWSDAKASSTRLQSSGYKGGDLDQEKDSDKDYHRVPLGDKEANRSATSQSSSASSLLSSSLLSASSRSRDNDNATLGNEAGEKMMATSDEVLRVVSNKTSSFEFEDSRSDLEVYHGDDEKLFDTPEVSRCSTGALAACIFESDESREVGDEEVQTQRVDISISLPSPYQEQQHQVGEVEITEPQISNDTSERWELTTNHSESERDSSADISSQSIGDISIGDAGNVQDKDRGDRDLLSEAIVRSANTRDSAIAEDSQVAATQSSVPELSAVAFLVEDTAIVALRLSDRSNDTASSSSSSHLPPSGSSSLSDDTPETAKIRRLIDEELNKRLTPNPNPQVSVSDSLLRPSISAEIETPRSRPRNSEPRLPFHVSVELVGQSQRTSEPTTSSHRHTPPAPKGNKNKVISKPAIEPVRSSVVGGVSNAVARALAAAAARRDVLTGSAHRFPGRQKQFVDDETERVSRIMLGTLQRNLV